MAGCKYVTEKGLFCPFPTGMMLFCSKKEGCILMEIHRMLSEQESLQKPAAASTSKKEDKPERSETKDKAEKVEMTVAASLKN